MAQYQMSTSNNPNQRTLPPQNKRRINVPPVMKIKSYYDKTGMGLSESKALEKLNISGADFKTGIKSMKDAGYKFTTKGKKVKGMFRDYWETIYFLVDDYKQETIFQ